MLNAADRAWMTTLRESLMGDSCVVTRHGETTTGGEVGQGASLLYSGKCALSTPGGPMQALVGDRVVTRLDTVLETPLSAPALLPGDEAVVTRADTGETATYRVTGDIPRTLRLVRRALVTRVA